MYFDDSPRSKAVLSSLSEAGPDRNLEDLARAVQARLDEESSRVLEADVAADADLFVPVRARLNAALLANKDLLERYRAIEEQAAQRDLAEGKLQRVEETRLLTRAGFEAVMRLAQIRLEQAQFASAAIMLEQLDLHPDRVGERARDAATLFDAIVRYLRDTQDAGTLKPRLELAAKWRHEGGVSPDRSDQPAEHPPLPAIRSSFDRADVLDLAGLLPKPLWSDFIGETTLGARPAERQGLHVIPADAMRLMSSPTVVGDAVFVSDGSIISGWNRFTLSPLWRVRVDVGRPGPPPFTPSGGEEPTNIASDGERVVALAGTQLQFDRPGAKRAVVALDAATGRAIWSRTIEDFGDPNLLEATISGPPLIHEGVVVLTAVKQIPQRRINSSYLVGLDVRTGKRLWSTALGSIGALPYGMRQLAGDLTIAKDGVAYRCDRIGFFASVETASGRLRWIRKMDGEFFGAPASVSPWEAASPVVFEGRVFTLSPDRREILMLDEAAGGILAREPAGRWNNPRYLELCGDRLVGITLQELYATDAASFGTQQPVNLLYAVDPPGLRGRVVVAGDRLVAPTVEGVLLVDSHAVPGTQPEEIRLDAPGVVLPMPGQVLVIDDARIHSYLLWEAAERQLRERMDAQPSDPLPAITFAELSYRANKPAEILPAVDRALRAIEADPISVRNERGRGRLFRSVLEMIEPGPGAPLGARLDNPAREALIDRLGRAASLPMERVAYFMAWGRYLENTEKPERAVQAYQSVLQTAVLSETTYTAGETTVPAEDEAARRLRRVVRERGRGVYAAFEAEAQRRFSSIEASLGPEPFEALAREYPVSRVAAKAWGEAATRYEAQGKPQLAVWALEEGMRLAQEALDRDDPVVGELGGRLVMLQVRAGRLYPAVSALERLTLRGSSIMLTDQGRPIDAKSLLDDLRSRLALLDRRPRIGTQLSAGPELVGVSLPTPHDARAPVAPPDRVLLSGQDSVLSMWKVQASGELAKLWDGSRGEAYIRQHADGVYLSHSVDDKTARDHVFIKRDPNSGAVLWETPPLRRQIHGRRQAPNLRVDLPMIPSADPDELVYAFDEQTLVVGTIVGGLTAFDLETGRSLWTLPHALDRIHDLCLLAGTLVVGGADFVVAKESDDALLVLDGTGKPTVASFDARSGQRVQTIRLRSEVRWLEPTPEGEMIVGVQKGLTMLDVFRGRVKWQAETKELAETALAAAAPGRIVVKSDDDYLWQVDTATGKLKPADALPTRDRFGPGYQFIELHSVGDFMVAATVRGLLVYDRNGAIAGSDSGPADQRLLSPAIAQDHAVTLSTAAEPVGDNFSAYELDVLSLPGCRAVAAIRIEASVDAPPTRIEVIDGKILVNIGSVVRVIEAPVTPGAASPPAGTANDR